MSQEPVPLHSILCTVFENKVKSHFKFELISWIGRTFMNRKPRKKPGTTKNILNLGAGYSYYDESINADFFVVALKFWKKPEWNPEWMLDIRYPLNCDDSFFDGVFTEHTLEHIYPNDVLSLLKELYRVMKPGAWIRIAVPDLRKYVDYYNGKPSHPNFTEMWPGEKAEALRNLTQNFHHLSTWDAELMGKFCKMAGFGDVKQVSFNEGTDKQLIKDLPVREWETLYMEARKPLAGI